MLALCAIGVSVFLYKVLTLGFPLTPNAQTDYWDVEAKISFRGRGEAAEVKIARVQDTPYLAILNESYLAPSGFGVTRTRIGDDRFATIERRTLSNRAIVFYRAILVDLDSAEDRPSTAPVAVSEYGAAARRAAAREEQTPFLFALDEIVRDARQRSAGETSFVQQIVEILSGDDERVRALRAGGPRGVSEPARRLALVLNAADVPARRVEGLRLEETARDIPISRWVEVWLDGAWRAMDPLSGETLPAERLLPLSIGDRALVRHTGVGDVYVSYAVERRPENTLTEALRRSDETAPIVSAISLLSLPLHTQDVFEVLLLVPIGGVLIAFFRQVVGLNSFGTFMPILIALSFRETSLITGLILFTSIVMIGLGLRAYFNQLQLLIVPRLAAVLTVVTLLMTAVALVANAFDIALGLSISLFPLVIITMTIERMSLAWDEYGSREALSRGGGSLIAATLGYLVMSNTYIEHYVFVFPELLLIAIALLLVLGRYNGYKFSEYLRFRSLADTAAPAAAAGASGPESARAAPESSDPKDPKDPKSGGG